MRTIQEVLRECDKTEIANMYVYDHAFDSRLCDSKYDDLTIGELKDNIKKHVCKLIDRLIDMTPSGSRNKDVFISHHSAQDWTTNDMSYDLFDVESIKDKNGKYTSWGYEFTPFEDTLNYGVPETYLNNYYLSTQVE